MALLEQTKGPASDLQTLVDRMFSEFPFSTEFAIPRFAPFTSRPAFDLYEKDGKYYLECAVPGYEPKDIDVEVSGSTVTVSGHRAETEEQKDAKYHAREIRHGSFMRTITLPQDIDADQVAATIDKGMLTLALTPVKQIAAKKVLVTAKA